MQPCACAHTYAKRHVPPQSTESLPPKLSTQPLQTACGGVHQAIARPLPTGCSTRPTPARRGRDSRHAAARRSRRASAPWPGARRGSAARQLLVAPRALLGGLGKTRGPSPHHQWPQHPRARAGLGAVLFVAVHEVVARHGAACRRPAGRAVCGRRRGGCGPLGAIPPPGPRTISPRSSRAPPRRIGGRARGSSRRHHGASAAAGGGSSGPRSGGCIGGCPRGPTAPGRASPRRADRPRRRTFRRGS